ncbi:ATP-binding protein [Corallococcus sp. RDP092CA]|uniref:sensor histidine kinase n=1 Tax=Corallococcus sp. RDP092CA TaxID=3109369 RepID=UPI0035AE7AEF
MALVLLLLAVGALLLTRASVQSRVMERSLDLQEVGLLGRAFSDKVSLANSALLAGGQSLSRDTGQARQRFLDTAERLRTRLAAPEDQALVEEIRIVEQAHEDALRALLDTSDDPEEQRRARERLARAHGRVREAQAQLERAVQARLARESQAAVRVDRWESALLLVASLLGLTVAAALAWVLQRRLHPLRREAAASAHRFQALVEGVRDYALVLLDARGRVASWNPGAERIQGWSEAEILGRPASRFYTSEEAAAGQSERELSRALLEGRLRTEGWRQRKDGSRFWAEVSITALRDEDGRPQGFSVVTRDITEQRRQERMQELLAEAGRVFQSLDPDLTAAEVARLLVPEVADGCILYLLTPAGELRPRAVTHVQPEREASLWEALRRFPPRVGMPPAVWEAMRTGRSRMDVEVEKDELAASAETDEHRLLIERIGIGSAMVVPLRTGSETLGAFVLLTARGHRRFTQADQVLVEELAGRAALALENTRLLREAREAVDLIAVTAHDLGNPLHALQLLLTKVQRAQAASRGEDVRQGLVAARGQAQRLGQLLHNLLDLSRLSSGKRLLDAAPMDLGELAREVVERFADAAVEAGCDLRLAVEAGQVGQWDRIRLDRVMTNLLSNALKFGRGHPVTVTVTALDADHSRLRVRDEGVGIAPEAQRRVFERFERERAAKAEAGYGLGLYIARQLVEAHGGAIRVESMPGCGSTFTVDLPRAPRPVEEPPPAESPPLQQAPPPP